MKLADIPAGSDVAYRSAAKLIAERSCTSVRMRPARRTGSPLVTRSRHRSGNSAANLRSQFGFRRNRGRGFCRPFGRTFLLH